MVSVLFALHVLFVFVTLVSGSSLIGNYNYKISPYIMSTPNHNYYSSISALNFYLYFLLGVYAPSNTFTNLRSLSTVDGSIISGSDIPIPVQANDYQNAGGEYDAITNTYSYRYPNSFYTA
jgi:hypothetical protein